jgi:hypothetical protein
MSNDPADAKPSHDVLDQEALVDAGAEETAETDAFAGVSERARGEAAIADLLDQQREVPLPTDADSEWR